jgi:hypothetical protein
MTVSAVLYDACQCTVACSGAAVYLTAAAMYAIPCCFRQQHHMSG